MLNLNKEATQLQTTDIPLGKCPVCGAFISHIYFMQDAKTKKQSKWYSCSCGIIFNVDKPSKVYDKKYWDDHDQFDKKLKDAFEYPVRIYAPMIEELTYGRRVLLVGRQTMHQEKYFCERGWVPLSIDKNLEQPNIGSVILDDFEKYQTSEKFNLIWLYGTLECFLEPISALSKCESLLTEDGIIFIASPDADFIHTRGSSGFIHWKPDMHSLIWNIDSITNHLEKLGFNVIMARRNYEHRFPAWDDFHLIAQKRFF